MQNRRVISGKTPTTGFTLVEALVSISIFAFIGLGSYAILENIIRAQEQIETRSAEMALMQKVSWQLGKDFRHMVYRPVMDTNGDMLEGFDSGKRDYLYEFTRSGWANPLGWTRSSLQRVAFSIEQHPEADDPESPFFRDERQFLVRNYWRVLDRGYESEPQKQVMIADVSDFFLRFLNPDSSDEPWTPTYTPKKGIGGSVVLKEPDAFDVPYAVEVNIVVGEDDLHTFVFPVRAGGEE